MCSTHIHPIVRNLVGKNSTHPFFVITYAEIYSVVVNKGAGFDFVWWCFYSHIFGVWWQFIVVCSFHNIIYLLNKKTRRSGSLGVSKILTYGVTLCRRPAPLGLQSAHAPYWITRVISAFCVWLSPNARTSIPAGVPCG